MVQDWIKFVRKQWRKEELLTTVKKIQSWDFSGLDISVIQWKQDYYRCRIWKIRIIFFKQGEKYYIEKVWSRWDIYKK